MGIAYFLGALSIVSEALVWPCMWIAYFLGALSIVSEALVWPCMWRAYFPSGNLLISASHICWTSCVNSESVVVGSDMGVLNKISSSGWESETKKCNLNCAIMTMIGLVLSPSFYFSLFREMNGPQRTACLAKGCINNQYQLTIPRQWAA